jgi:hypothetical protein
MKPETRLLVKVPLRVMAASMGYALALAMAERKMRLKPDHEWVEVALGVGLALVPVALEAHAIEEEQGHTNAPPIAWETYEGAIWRCFLAAGAPIILWQVGETMMRKLELMRYLTTLEHEHYADEPPANVLHFPRFWWNRRMS